MGKLHNSKPMRVTTTLKIIRQPVTALGMVKELVVAEAKAWDVEREMQMEVVTEQVVELGR